VIPRDRASFRAGMDLHGKHVLVTGASRGIGEARGCGHLVNMSSLAGVVAFPGMAVYGASKAPAPP
jgi:short-subunit dehydrogenase